VDATFALDGGTTVLQTVIQVDGRDRHGLVVRAAPRPRMEASPALTVRSSACRERRVCESWTRQSRLGEDRRAAARGSGRAAMRGDWIEFVRFGDRGDSWRLGFDLLIRKSIDGSRS
jgi:hypothetical protein